MYRLVRGAQVGKQALKVATSAEQVAVMRANPGVQRLIKKKYGKENFNHQDLIRSGVSFGSIIEAAFESTFYKGMKIDYSKYGGLTDLTKQRFYFGERPGETLSSQQANRAIELCRGTSYDEVDVAGTLRCLVAEEYAEGFDGSIQGMDRPEHTEYHLPSSTHKAGGSSRISTTSHSSVATLFAMSGIWRGRVSSVITSIAPYLINPALMVREDKHGHIRGVFTPEEAPPTVASSDGSDESYDGEFEVSLAGTVPGFLLPLTTGLVGPLPSGVVHLNPDYIDAAVVLTNPMLLEELGDLIDDYQRLHMEIPLRDISLGKVEPTEEHIMKMMTLNERETMFQWAYQGYVEGLKMALTQEQVETFVEEWAAIARGKPFVSNLETMIAAYDKCKHDLKIPGQQMMFRAPAPLERGPKIQELEDAPKVKPKKDPKA